jgi:hypothetical protein
MISQKSIDWLTNNVHDDSNNTLNQSIKKPKFIKMYGKTRSDTIWYKSIKNNQDGSEILVPAKPEEIKFWNLK